jgi:hypothetical protein
MAEAVADAQELQDYIQKRNMDLSAAQKFLNDYMVLKELAQEYDSPLIEYLREKLEISMRQHGVAILQNHGPEKEWALECECGKTINLHRAYFHVYNEAWKKITEIIKTWYKKNTAIKAGAKR